MTKAFIYLRVSTDDKGQDHELQLKDCQELATKKGIEIVKVFKEDVSAYDDDSKRLEFKSMILEAKRSHIDYIIVWSMDRFSRQPEDVVLRQVKDLAMSGVKVLAVHGDAWSEICESVGVLKTMGTIGEATYEFLEKVICGMEYSRGNRESKIKSEHIKKAVKKTKEGKTISYRGNKWGRKNLPKQTVTRVWELSKEGKSIREIARIVKYYQDDRERSISVGSVHKILAQKHGQKDGE